MLLAHLTLALAAELPDAAPPTWSPLRVAIECQSSGRSDECTLLRGVLDTLAVVSVVPRASAQVTLYVNVTTRANDDLVHLRFVGEVPGAPGEYEQLQALDSRVGVEAQQEHLQPALLRGLAPFLSVYLPESVKIEISAPSATRTEGPTTPWGCSAWAGGWGSWTRDYQALSLWTGASVWRTTNDQKWFMWGGYDRNIERQPSLEIDGTSIPLSADSSSLNGATAYAYNLGPAWTIGAVVRGGHDDPEGQYLGTARAHAGVERNWFPSDHPRGNRLSAAWLVGGQADWYNQTNAIGETHAYFPTHMLLVSGSVRVDTLTIELDLAAQSELLDPLRRYALSAKSDLELKVGDHVDLTLRMGVTQQAIPGPGEVDQSSYEEVTRASYAEPLQVEGNLNLRFHWDNTNDARNNRFGSAGDLEPTGNL